MKVDRIMKLLEKFKTHVSHLDVLFYKKTFDNVHLKRCKTSIISFSQSI